MSNPFELGDRIKALTSFANSEEGERILNAWELDFIDSISIWEGAFSDKQIEWINRIYEEKYQESIPF